MVNRYLHDSYILSSFIAKHFFKECYTSISHHTEISTGKYILLKMFIIVTNSNHLDSFSYYFHYSESIGKSHRHYFFLKVKKKILV